MLQDCTKRLSWIGYEYKDDYDNELLNYILNKVCTEVKVGCNISEIPDELKAYVIDRAAGEFLLNRKDTGKLNLGDVDLNGATKSIQMGDTKVEIDTDGSKTPEERFDALINYLVTNKKELLVSFRKLRW